ncbi:MAG: MmcQ/YjbR family DNA-binding protein [Bacteroidetes bacterium]|nr:MmcQ/YjbR family DNA-binding protein [Bacteroidota bacterium]
MHLEWIRDTCLSCPCATEDLPFDDQVLVFRVAGKIFGLISLDEPDHMNLKADPERSVEWRATYPQIQPGYHMNKTHWNTVYFEGLPAAFIQEMIEHSYRTVMNKLPLKLRNQLMNT